jgi:heme exporter protein D
MNGGIVVGGWQFVWSAYGITGAALLIYGLTLFARLRQVKGNAR